MDIRGRRLKRFDSGASRFYSSIGFDGPIARHVIKINTAHMISLVKAGEVERGVGEECLRFLSKETPRPRRAKGAEDIHQLIEQNAVDRLGVEIAGFLNLGKSRNDQVASAVRMELRERVIRLLEAIADLQAALLKIVRKFGRAVIPGYTHMQHAMPVTLGHHFSAYFDAFQREIDRLVQLYARVNVSPMGAAALAGTSVAVDRTAVSDFLGFAGIVENSIDAVSSRDFVVEALACSETIMLDLSRLSEEIILWSSKEFGYLEVSDEYANSSSIMPQKKNPVAAETVRAKCGSVLGSLVAVCAILKALPYTYNLDLQELTPHLWRGLDDTLASTIVTAGMVGTLKFDVRALRLSLKGDYSTATAFANYLVKAHGVSFRQAHAIVGGLVRMSVETGTPFELTISKHLSPLSREITGKPIHLAQGVLNGVLDPASSLHALSSSGSANPKFLQRGVEKRLSQLESNRSSVRRIREGLSRADALLLRNVNSVLKGVKK
ncbi:MAG: argininosuccinate lyase [Thaumarchaeota archaeon]|nr:argininosuccinate lyase [Nitrososphaerota archaeon]